MRICGIDEAGRGTLAGSLFVAGVVLEIEIEGLRDSKKLSKKNRFMLYDEIVQNAIKEIQNFNETAKGKKLNEIFKSIPENRYVNLKSTGNNVKKTLVVVTDPECPYCRNEMKTIEEKLKDHHIKIILAPVGARTAFVKSQIAMDKIKEAKSDKEKISILREVYADSYKIPENLRNQPTKLIDENAEKIYSSGLIRGVPFVFEME